MSDSNKKGGDQPVLPPPSARPPKGPASKPPPGAPPPSPAMGKRAPGVRNATEAPAEPTTLRTGDTVGGAFVVERYLGSSGGAISYLCNQKGEDDQVVIKVLSQPYPGDEAFQKLRERIKVANSIRQRNLTKILGMGKTGQDEMFVAMEYVRGSTVSKLVAQRREAGENLHLRDVFTILAHVCDALEVVHQRTAHGVLTPYNIYLSHKGVVKVGNLIFDRIAGEYMAEAKGEGPFVDSIYVAPEVAQNPKKVTPAADMFSLGMLAAELLGDKGLPNDAKRARHVALDGMGKYPPSLVNLIASCIDSAPQNRPANVGVFRDTFEDAAREAGAKLGGAPPEGCLPIEPAVEDEGEEEVDEDSDLFDIDLPGFGDAEADEGEERYLVQKDGLDYGPFTKQQVLEQLYADDIDEYTPVLDRVTQERIDLGEMEQFAEEVAEYIPKREERRRREAEARAELERKVKKGATLGLKIAVGVAVVVLGFLVWQYYNLPDPEPLPMNQAFASMDYKFLPPPKDFQTVAVDKDLMASIFNPDASEEEIARKIKRRSKKGGRRRKGSGGGNSGVTEVDLSDGAGSGHFLSDYEINQIIMSHFGRLRGCIMQELKSNRSFKGVTVQFFIRPSGTTGGVKIRESKYSNRPVGACLKRRFRSMKFPEHGAVSNKGVTFPLRVQ